MNIFSYGQSTGGKYGLRVAAASDKLENASLVAQNIAGEDAKDYLCRTWDVSILTSAIEEMITSAQSNTISFIKSHYAPVFAEAIETIRQNQDRRQRYHIYMPTFKTADSQYFDQLAKGTDPKSVLMGAVNKACQSDGSIDIFIFTQQMVVALDYIFDHAEV